jgi:putative ABC transport system permease protein
MRDFLRTFRLPIRSRRDIRRAVDEELAFHMEAAETEWIESGLSPEEAAARALAEFGSLEDTRNYCVGQGTRRDRQERRAMRFEEFIQDLTYAGRTLRRSPAYALVVVTTLAVGIAANTLIFSILNPYFLRPLPYGEAEELVQIGQTQETGWIWGRFSLAQIEDWASRSQAVEEWAAYYYSAANVTGPEGPERIQYGWVTDNLFQTLQAPAALGRTIQPGDGGPAGEDVVVIAHGLWQRRYGGDPGILGRTIAVDGVQRTVVGVMPPDFNFPFGDIYMWLPDPASAGSEDRDRTAHIPIGRLGPGQTPESAQADLARVQRELSGLYPEVDGRFQGVTVKPIRQALNFAWDQLQIGFAVLLAAVGLVLLIVCVNIAGLTVARASGRTRELAVRAAVGADRRRLIRQLLTESLLLALVGGALGVAIAYATSGFLDTLLPPGLFKVGGVALDGRVLLFTAAVTVATPLFFGLLPALSSARTDLSAALREGGQGSGHGKRSMRKRRILVVSEVALAIVLVTATGLMVRSFMEVRGLDLGYDAASVLTVEMRLPDSDYPETADLREFYGAVGEELGALPGVEALGQVYPMVMNHESMVAEFARAGVLPPGDRWPQALTTWSDGGYFGAMGIPMIMGRTFEEMDGREGDRVAIISEGIAQRLWPAESPLGQTLVLESEARTEYTIVGVVGDVYHEGFDGQGPDLHVYRPLAEREFRRRFAVIRAAGPPSALVGGARRVLADADPTLPADFRPLGEIVAENDFPWRLGSIFLAVFGGVALFLAALGIYGLIAYSVAQRRKEMGLRIAMGATSGQINRIIVGEGLRLTALGMAVGLVLALGVARLAQSIFYGVSASDPTTLLSVVALFLVVAAAASFFPARRAGRVHPAVVLRSE